MYIFFQINLHIASHVAPLHMVCVNTGHIASHVAPLHMVCVNTGHIASHVAPLHMVCVNTGHIDIVCPIHAQHALRDCTTKLII